MVHFDITFLFYITAWCIGTELFKFFFSLPLFFLLLSLKSSKELLCTMWFEVEKGIHFEQAFCFSKYPFQDPCVYIGVNGTASKDKDECFILSVENNLLSAEKLFELVGAQI